MIDQEPKIISFNYCMNCGDSPPLCRCPEYEESVAALPKEEQWRRVLGEELFGDGPITAKADPLRVRSMATARNTSCLLCGRLLRFAPGQERQACDCGAIITRHTELCEGDAAPYWVM